MTDEEREDMNTFKHDLVKQARWWQWKAETLEKENEQLKSENTALRNEADENAALSMENKMRADHLEAENAALRERIDNAVKRLKDREQSVCFGWEWKGVVTDKDIDEVFGVTESSLEEPEGGEE